MIRFIALLCVTLLTVSIVVQAQIDVDAILSAGNWIGGQTLRNSCNGRKAFVVVSWIGEYARSPLSAACTGIACTSTATGIVVTVSSVQSYSHSPTSYQNLAFCLDSSASLTMNTHRIRSTASLDEICLTGYTCGVVIISNNDILYSKNWTRSSLLSETRPTTANVALSLASSINQQPTANPSANPSASPSVVPTPAPSLSPTAGEFCPYPSREYNLHFDSTLDPNTDKVRWALFEYTDMVGSIVYQGTTGTDQRWCLPAGKYALDVNSCDGWGGTFTLSYGTSYSMTKSVAKSTVIQFIIPQVYVPPLCSVSTQKQLKVTVYPDSMFYTETSWDLLQLAGSNTDYLYQNSQSNATTCLDVGTYYVLLKDTGKNGVCCSFGKGKVQIYLDGRLNTTYTSFGESAAFYFVNTGN